MNIVPTYLIFCSTSINNNEYKIKLIIKFKIYSNSFKKWFFETRNQMIKKGYKTP